MITYTIQHNYCGAIAHITGFDAFHAFKRCNRNPAYWTVIAEEKK